MMIDDQREMVSMGKYVFDVVVVVVFFVGHKMRIPCCDIHRKTSQREDLQRLKKCECTYILDYGKGTTVYCTHSPTTSNRLRASLRRHMKLQYFTHDGWCKVSCVSPRRTNRQSCVSSRSTIDRACVQYSWRNGVWKRKIWDFSCIR